jgi:hypothetical protein
VSAPPFFDLPLFPETLLSVLYKATAVPTWSQVVSHMLYNDLQRDDVPTAGRGFCQESRQDWES